MIQGFINRKNGKRYQLVILVLLSSIYSSFSQSTISTSGFLNEALDNDAILLQQKQLDFLNENNYELPWADELEFRTETDEMDFDRQEYLMRFRYHTKKEREIQGRIHHSAIQYEELAQSVLLEEALLDRYYFLVKYFFGMRKVLLLKQQLLVANDVLTVLRKKAIALGEADLDELLDVEERTHVLALDILEAESKQEQRQASAGMMADRFLDTSDFISINIILDKINNWEVLPPSGLVFYKRQLDLTKNELSYEKDKAEDNWQIDYVQFKYAGRDQLNFAREWSVGVGVEVPLANSGRLEKNEFLLNKIKIENKISLEKNKTAEALSQILQEAKLKIRQYELIAKQLKGSQLAYTSDRYATFSEADPLILLKTKSSLLKKQEKRLALMEDIYTLYLELIEVSGKIIEPPLKNYLTGDWVLLK